MNAPLVFSSNSIITVSAIGEDVTAFLGDA
jgi:hypothetical protein